MVLLKVNRERTPNSKVTVLALLMKNQPNGEEELLKKDVKTYEEQFKLMNNNMNKNSETFPSTIIV